MQLQLSHLTEPFMRNLTNFVNSESSVRTSYERIDNYVKHNGKEGLIQDIAKNPAMYKGRRIYKGVIC